MTVRLCDTVRQYDSMKDQIDAAIERVLRTGRFILGPEVSSLEAEIAALSDCTGAVGVASGTDALLLSLAALNVSPGDEVITTPFTFVSTAEVISLRGATPVFADVTPETYNLDPAAVEACITSRTVGIIPVDLYGQMADWEALDRIAQKHHLWMVEDACQALGATRDGRKAGSYGALAAISFFPTKNLGAFGDGGMVVGRDRALLDRVRMLRYHGSAGGYDYDYIGYNSRLDELQAAILRAKLPHLLDWNEARRRTAKQYQNVKSSILTHPVDQTNGGHVWHQYTVRTAQRDELAAHLKHQGIESKVYYPAPLHLQNTYSHLGYKSGSLPESEAAAQQVLSVPITQELNSEERERVAQALAAFQP